MAFVCLLHPGTTRGRLERGFSSGAVGGARAGEAGSARARARRSSPAARRSGARARRPVAGLSGARGTPEGRGSRRLSFVRRSDNSIWGAGRNVGAAGLFSLSCSNSGECGLNRSHGLRA